MLNDAYLTISKPAEGIFKDKGSKFLAFAFPISSEEEALGWVKQFREKYHDARHHCYAFALGQNRKFSRANDDGEPSGTAGRPILGQIVSKELTNILVVVVRYFGGTLLGTSGLINAYKSATCDVLGNAEIIEKHISQKLNIRFNYIVLNDVMKIVKDYGANIESQILDNECSIDLLVRLGLYPQVLAKLKKIEGLSHSEQAMN